MAAEQSSRLGVYTWSSGQDSFTRDQMTTSHENLEQRAAVFLSGTLANRPAVPSSANQRVFYLATNENSPTGVLYYSDGSTWQPVNKYDLPGTSTPGDTASAGTGTSLARSNHRHAMPDWGAAGEIQPTSTSSSAGVNSKFARIDHQHIIGPNTVTAGTIAAGGVSNSNQLANNVVTTSAIANAAVTQAKLDAGLLVPIGTIIQWAGPSATAPNGWLFCDGSSQLRASYQALFDVIGTTYGTGDSGATTFSLPDLRSRFPLGAGQGAGLTNRVVGNTDGVERVTLTQSELAQHSHTANHDHGTVSTTTIGNHQHGYDGIVFVGAFGNIPNNTGAPEPGRFQANAGNTVAAGSHSHNVTIPNLNLTTSAVGSNSSHENMPPFIVLNHLIKT